jgi:membrane-bound lytic murein transglycosylase A
MRRSRARFVLGITCTVGLTAAMSTVAHAAVLKLRNADTQTITFDALPGWADDDHTVAFEAFLNSCDAIRHGSKRKRRKSPIYGGLYNACMRAIPAGTLDRKAARKFFEDNFKPVRVTTNQTIGYYSGTDGFYTGYWEVQVRGSRKKTEEFTVPLYRTPRGKFARLDRARIVGGALEGKGLEICWIKDPIDAFFAEIQGSLRVHLDTGELLRLNYDSSNRKPYTPVGRILIERDIYTPEEMSMEKIREYMIANPEEGKKLRLKNRSYIFFKETELEKDEEPDGAQGVPLTAGRSLAVDSSHHVYGTPIWIDAKLPITSDEADDTFRRLMFAQDTGGAIRGAARADIYFGHGEGLGAVAGRIKQFGKFVMLVPKDVSVRDTLATPLPRPKPKTMIAEAAPTLAAKSKPPPLPRPAPAERQTKK